MGIDVKITDGEGTGKDLAVVKPEARLPRGVVAYTEPYRKGTVQTKLFSNPTFGFDMNQDAGFTGTPEGVHNGTDSALWTASAISGTWTFDSTTQAHSGTKSIDASAATNNKEMLLSDATSITANSYVSLTGWIYVTAWSVDNSEVTIRTRNAGVEQGTPVSLSNFITEGTFGVWQKFNIPMASFGVTSETIDELVIRQDAGPAADYFLDDIQWEEAGGSLVFEVRPTAGTRFHLTKSVFTGASAVASTLADATMPSVSIDKFFGISALTTGITIQFSIGGNLTFSGLFRENFDFISFGSQVDAFGSDGTNTWYRFSALSAVANEELVLDARTNDFMTITINDDLSSLVKFRALLTGWEEPIIAGQN